MIVQLWNTNTPAIVSCDADLTENYMYISMKFRTGVHVFCWEVGVFNRSCYQSVTVNVVIFTGGKFRENVGKTFHVGVMFTIFHLFSFIKSYGFNFPRGGNFREKCHIAKNA